MIFTLRVAYLWKHDNAPMLAYQSSNLKYIHFQHLPNNTQMAQVLEITYLSTYLDKRPTWHSISNDAKVNEVKLVLKHKFNMWYVIMIESTKAVLKRASTYVYNNGKRKIRKI